MEEGFGAYTRTRTRTLTGVVEEGVDEGAVVEGGAHGGDVLEVAVEKRRVDERDGFELHGDEPGGREGGGGGRGNECTHGKDSRRKMEKNTNCGGRKYFERKASRG